MHTKRRFINVNFTMSYEEHEEGFTMPEYHVHNDYEIYVLTSGRRIVSIEDREYETLAGDVMIFKSELPHKSRGEEAFSGVCIHFSERYLTKFFAGPAIERIKSLLNKEFIHLNEERLVSIKNMTEEFETEAENNFLKLARIFDILRMPAVETKDSVDILKSEVLDKNVDIKNTGRAAEVFGYVEENYAYIKNAAEVAKLFEISESYLFRIFKNKYGMTFKTYINRLRIKNICKRLKYSDDTLKNLATEYGFESYEHFSRVFRKVKGCSPTEYRENIQTG